MTISARGAYNRAVSQCHFLFLGRKDITKKTDRGDFFSEDQTIRARLRKQVWPARYLAVFNFQLDDFCVKTKKNAEYDYGGDPRAGAGKSFLDLMRQLPQVKTTLFMIPDPLFIKDNHYNHAVHPQGKYSCANPRYEAWVQWITSSQFTRRHEIAQHGYHHLQTDVRGVLPYCEFEFKDEPSALAAITGGNNLMRQIGIEAAGFKPPTWSVGHNADFGLVKALKRIPFQYVCLSSPVSGLNWDIKRVSNIYPTYYQGLLNIPQNINLNWPMEKIQRVVDGIVSRNGVITLQAHFNTQDDWMSDGLGEGNNKKIAQIVRYLETKYPRKIWFAQLQEVARWWKERKYLA